MMYLRDYLHDIPLRLLKRIAQRVGASAEYGARIKLLNAVDRAFWNEGLVSRMMAGMPDEERRVLSFVAFSFDSGADDDVLLRKADVAPDQLNLILDDLILNGLIGGYRKIEERYFPLRGPAEQVRKIIYDGMILPPGSQRTGIPPAPFPALLEDIYSLMAAAHREPLPVTLKGHIRKTVLDRIFVGSPISDDPGFNSHRDGFVVGYLQTRGIMHPGGRYATLSGSFESWLDLGISSRIQDIAAYGIRHYLVDDSVIVPFTGMFNEFLPGTAVHPAGLARFLHERTLASHSVAVLKSRVQNVLSCLYYLGAFALEGDDYILTETGAALFRGDPIPLEKAVSGSFTLQPDFEVFVGPELNPRVRFTLELMSTRKKRDIILTNVIEKAGIARARERGMSVGEVLSFFERHSRTALPQNVRFSIANWAEAYGNVSFEQVTLMRFRNGNDCESIIHIPSVAPYIRERISDTAVVIPDDKVQAIAAMLKDAGWFPDLSGESECDPAPHERTFQPASIREIVSTRDFPPMTRGFVVPDELPGDDKPPDKDIE